MFVQKHINVLTEHCCDELESEQRYAKKSNGTEVQQRRMNTFPYLHIRKGFHWKSQSLKTLLVKSTRRLNVEYSVMQSTRLILLLATACSITNE